MYCSKCGHANKDSSIFCRQCGVPLSIENETVQSRKQENDETESLFGSTVPSNTAPTAPHSNFKQPANFYGFSESGLKEKEKKKLRLPIIITIVLVVVICGAAAAVFGVSALETKKYDELIDTGNKYIEELKYEEAVETFIEAIDVKPMQEEAYVGAAKGYIGLGEPEKAKDILEQGLDNVREPGDEFIELYDELEEVYEVSTMAETSEAGATETETETTEVSAEDWVSVYEPVLTKYRKFAMLYFKDYDLSTEDPNWGPVAGENGGLTAVEFGYALRDIDQNGTPELLLLYKNEYNILFFINDIYTYVDDTPILLSTFYPRSACYLNESNYIYNSWSDGASDCGWSVYRISMDGRQFELVETVAVESFYENNEILPIPRYYRCVGSENDKEFITEQQAEDAWATYPSDNDSSQLKFILLVSSNEED